MNVIPGNSNNASASIISKLRLLTRCQRDRAGVTNLMAGGQGGIGRIGDNGLTFPGRSHNLRNGVGFLENPWQEAKKACVSSAGTAPTILEAIEI